MVNVHAMIATGLNAEGHHEALGIQVSSAEDGAGWPGLLEGPPRPRARWGEADDQPRPRWAGHRERGHPARGRVAEVPHALSL